MQALLARDRRTAVYLRGGGCQCEYECTRNKVRLPLIERQIKIHTSLSMDVQSLHTVYSPLLSTFASTLFAPFLSSWELPKSIMTSRI